MALNQDRADIIDLDRDDSPETLCGDPPQNLIDLDPLDDTPGINQDDFMTDQDFDRIFGQKESLTINGITYKKGKTVQLRNGDFLRISDILEDTQTREVMLRGTHFRRASRFQGLFDQHLNELVLLIEHMEEQHPLDKKIESETIPLSNVAKIRELILTNEAYPLYCFRQDERNLTLPRAYARENCRLVCRWKVFLTYRLKGTRKACVEMSITRLLAPEVDHPFSTTDEVLRQAWRGATTKGGSCPRWLPGEDEFNANERRIGYGSHPLRIGRDDNTVDLTIDARPSHTGQRYTFGDAFCGAGGASRGAKDAGYRVDWGFDFDPAAIESYRLNFYAARCEATPADVFVTYLEENYIVDVLHLSPPCKTFSPIHTRAGRDDDMNSASFFAVTEILRKTKPRIVTLENTFGLVERWKDWLSSMVRFFTALGFSVRWKVLNLAQYGLAQARRRLIVIASCPGESLPTYPNLTHGPGRIPYSTVDDAIGMIPLGSPNHDVAACPSRAAEPYDAKAPLRNCITTAGSLDIHPSGRRCFTDRELACLQGFPLEHKFGRTKIKMQIGNAVPPLVAKVLFGHVRQWLEESDRIGR
ncbi:MAG: hypothetical protein Q9219_001502 [cf. Caloplaca sp. 3 TL-2023]